MSVKMSDSGGQETRQGSPLLFNSHHYNMAGYVMCEPYQGPLPDPRQEKNIFNKCLYWIKAMPTI